MNLNLWQYKKSTYSYIPFVALVFIEIFYKKIQVWTCSHRAWLPCDNLSSEKQGVEYPQEQSTDIHTMGSCMVGSYTSLHAWAWCGKGWSQGIQTPHYCNAVQAIQPYSPELDTLYHRAAAYKWDICWIPLLYSFNRVCVQCGTAGTEALFQTSTKNMYKIWRII